MGYHKMSIDTVNFLYADTQEVTVNQKLCKNIVFNTSRNMFWIFVSNSN